MPWTTFDDTFPLHRKIAPLSDGAFRLHVCAIVWSNTALTDGHIPPRTVKKDWKHLALSCGRASIPDRLITELEEARVWEPADDGGWDIHDYHDYQLSKDDVEARRQARAEAGRAGATARWGAGAKPHGKPDSKPHGTTDAERMRSGCDLDAPVPMPLPLPKTKAAAARLETTHDPQPSPESAAAATSFDQAYRTALTAHNSPYIPEVANRFITKAVMLMGDLAVPPEIIRDAIAVCVEEGKRPDLLPHIASDLLAAKHRSVR